MYIREVCIVHVLGGHGMVPAIRDPLPIRKVIPQCVLGIGAVSSRRLRTGFFLGY